MAKFLAIAWALTGAITLVVWVMPDLLVIGFILLILPGLILSAMPTVFLYQSVFTAVWFAVRSRGNGAAIAAGLLSCALLAIQVPVLLNGVTARRLKEADAQERPRTSSVEVLGKTPLASIVLELSASHADRLVCDALCQTLLYNDIATEVQVSGGSPSGKKPPVPRTYRIQRDDCVVDAATMTSLRRSASSVWTTQERATAVRRAVRSRVAGQECLQAEEGGGNAPSAVRVRFVDDYLGGPTGKLSLMPAGVRMAGVEVSQGTQILARETRQDASPLALPLHLIPISSGMGFRGWQWAVVATKADSSKPLDRLALLEQLTPWDLAVPWGSSRLSVRQRLDQALAQPHGSNAAFALLPEYYESLREDDLDEEDRDRLARLILDERVDDFSYFDWSEKQRTKVGRAIRDAMLRRLLAEQSREQKRITPQLDRLAGQLSPGTFAGPVPHLDALLQNASSRRFYPQLVRRLSDQGPAGGEKLVAILEEAWAVPDRSFASGREAEAATDGLCRLGQEARQFLPRLRAIDAKYQRESFVRGHAWRGLLIALGADATEFRSDAHRDAARYAQDLRRAAHACEVKAEKHRPARRIPRSGV